MSIKKSCKLFFTTDSPSSLRIFPILTVVSKRGSHWDFIWAFLLHPGRWYRQPSQHIWRVSWVAQKWPLGGNKHVRQWQTLLQTSNDPFLYIIFTRSCVLRIGREHFGRRRAELYLLISSPLSITRVAGNRETGGRRSNFKLFASKITRSVRAPEKQILFGGILLFVKMLVSYQW